MALGPTSVSPLARQLSVGAVVDSIIHNGPVSRAAVAKATGRPCRQTAMRGGLNWIDTECRRRCGQDFVDATAAQQVELLDSIAFAEAKGAGAAFFSSFRDLVASGFWSSKMGIEDLGYKGNVPTVWQGPPADVLKKMGLED